ncbi:DUF2807 domain-containing protein [Microbacterium sp. CFBP 8794]|uniref:DUF2807 domain-containing protein n=1 Tax=Microbacterium sp. CFBP 8794 TaxID=2775269 RepID=UPI0017854242|nr:DUF2807 domain-containing protein [Microbacterium sp. CFBP 8794]MBD8478744.1 DUF2807 domain-containing protein [Microbacterium sp. CFBP 8794]
MTVQPPLDPTPPAPPRRRGTALAVSIATIVVGGCVLLGAVVGTGVSAAATFRDSGTAVDAGETSTNGLTDLDVEVAGGALTIEYGDVADARLDTSGRDSSGWTFERDGDTLRVSSPRAGLVGWAGDATSATLTLPRTSATTDLDARIDVAGGALDLDIDLASLTVELAGGTVDLSGSARTLDVSVAGGAASTTLTGVDTATFEVAGGNLSATLDGGAPAHTTVKVTAGSADVTLPDDAYDVTIDGGLGNVDNRLRTSPSATSVVDVEAELGQVSLTS